MDEKQQNEKTLKELQSETNQLSVNRRLDYSQAFQNTQENLVYSGQRKINLIWEVTQAVIALVVVIGNMAAGLVYMISRLQGKDIDIPTVMISALFLIIGFYFSRTNHQAIGGIGKKADMEQPYQGR